MHIGLKVGIAAATAGTVGFGALKMGQSINESTKRKHAELDVEVAKQTKAWDAWSTAFKAEFPGHRLDTPADHARLDVFLRQNPAPSWVSVDHDGYTRARLSIQGDVVDDKHIPVEREKAIGYGAIGAISSAAIGVGFLRSGLMSSGSTLGTVGKLVGGAATVAMGVGMLGIVVGDVKRGTNLDGYHQFLGRVRSEMQD